jgi:hypothetical protein
VTLLADHSCARGPGPAGPLARDYSKEIAFIRRVGSVVTKAEALEIILSPVAAVATARGVTGPFGRAVAAVHISCKTVESASWSIGRWLGTSDYCSKAIHSLWKNAPTIATFRGAGTTEYWRDVCGVPISSTNNSPDYVSSPEPAEATLRRIGGSMLSVVQGSIAPYDPGPLFTPTTRVSEIIARTRRFDSCRSWLFHGPPGGGKSKAAQQVVSALCSSIVWMDSASASQADSWAVVHAVQPQGIVVDDLDSVAEKDPLLGHMSKARNYARVIIATVNVRDGLRGALTRPQRFADDRPEYFGCLDSQAAAALAPTVPTGMRDPTLLASYLIELERRAVAGVLAPDGSDLLEMLKRQAEAGDR